MLQFVVLLALFAISQADVPSVPVTVNSIAPVAVLSSGSFANPNEANEFTEWAEYKVKP